MSLNSHMLEIPKGVLNKENGFSLDVGKNFIIDSFLNFYKIIYFKKFMQYRYLLLKH